MGFRQWIEPRSTVERIAQQELLVNILSLAALLLGTLYLLVAAAILLFIEGQLEVVSLVGGGICVVIAGAAYVLSRAGHARTGAILIVCGAILLALYSGYVRGTVTVAAMLLVPGILFAGVAVGGHAGVIAAVVEFVLYIALTVALSLGWLPHAAQDLSPLTGLVLVGANLALLALVLWQTLRAQDSFLQRAEDRGRALEALANDKDRLVAELQAREETQRRLVETVRELGSPVIPLSTGIIAMPLIGAVDEERAHQVIGALLQGVAAHRARVAIVDITGVPVVDTAVAEALLRAGQGVRLLGAELVLTGIRAEVARLLVGLGLDLAGVVTQATLQEGLDYALQSERRG
jgi:anti-anti-sigma regulatory factor